MPSQLPVPRQNNPSHLVDVTALRDEILTAVQRDLMAAVANALSQVSIQVPAPQVHVAAPNVTVDAPALPAFPAWPDQTITLHVPGVVELTQALDRVDSHLARLEQILLMPVTKDVHRRADQLIDTVTETRGK